MGLFSLCLMTAEAQPCQSLDTMHWLSGDWEYKDAKQEIREYWLVVSSNTMEGHGVSISNTMTSRETLRIVVMSGEVFYFAKVASNSLPIAFKLTHCESDRLIFENKHHDFPQKIIYQFINPNKITVFVSGEDNKGFKVNYQRQRR
ncbi:DUF6265 family protein [uncultured Shewanella sp.]|uniref:DUF6265 family protein n=1 Tax=uncultured Shewanella sp. TaxID=173975 RepID=UPI00262F2AAD|nr:DUF6265 family protein [uncultured Shewanella sp.]